MNHNDREEIGSTVADFVAEGEALEAPITHNAEIARKETEDAYGESAQGHLAAGAACKAVELQRRARTASAVTP